MSVREATDFCLLSALMYGEGLTTEEKANIAAAVNRAITTLDLLPADIAREIIDGCKEITGEDQIRELEIAIASAERDWETNEK